MSSLIARTGRERQRYMDQLRLVAGCIPYKTEKNVEGDDQKCRIKLLMISTPKRDDLVFPKGGWEDDETVDEAASREALEEAGVRGILGEHPLGVWEFRSKSNQNSSSMEGGCRGYMFALEVTQELPNWPGQATYSRKWLSIKEAFKHCRYDWMREALKQFVAALPKEGHPISQCSVRNNSDNRIPICEKGCFGIGNPSDQPKESSHEFEESSSSSTKRVVHTEFIGVN